eukprot:289136-Prymnesium_polylepis.2
MLLSLKLYFPYRDMRILREMRSLTFLRGAPTIVWCDGSVRSEWAKARILGMRRSFGSDFVRTRRRSAHGLITSASALGEQIDGLRCKTLGGCGSAEQVGIQNAQRTDECDAALEPVRLGVA